MSVHKLRPKSWESYLKAQARRIWSWSAERKNARARAKVGADRSGNHLYRCEQCDVQPLEKSAVQVDHIVCVESVEGFKGDWTGWLGRLFCPVDGLMILCMPCHSAKSERENAKRPHRNRNKVTK